MGLLLLAFALLMIGAGLGILLQPKIVMAYISRYSGSLALYLSAVLVRLFVGIALILYAAQSKFPLTLTILGWLFVAAALAIVIMGRNRLKRIIDWAFAFLMPYARLAGLLAIGLGSFLAYAVV